MNKIFESINNKADSASEIGEKYLKDTKEYFILKIFEQLTISISMIAKVLIIGSLLFIGLMFLSVAASLAIGKWLDDVALGYVIVSVIFLICGIITYYSRAVISNKIIAKMSSKFFNS